MPCVRIVFGGRSLRPHKLHYLVFPLAGNRRIRYNDFELDRVRNADYRDKFDEEDDTFSQAGSVLSL